MYDDEDLGGACRCTLGPEECIITVMRSNRTIEKLHSFRLKMFGKASKYLGEQETEANGLQSWLAKLTSSKADKLV